jgi:hypothetical protein
MLARYVWFSIREARNRDGLGVRREIISWSLERKATVITLDADFHAILATPGAFAPSVVLLEFEFDLLNGSLVTVKQTRQTPDRHILIGCFTRDLSGQVYLSDLLPRSFSSRACELPLNRHSSRIYFQPWSSQVGW